MKNSIKVFGLSLLLATVFMTVSAPSSLAVDRNHLQSVEKTNVQGSLDKVSYIKQYGHTYAVITGRATDPTDKQPVRLEFYFRSSTDPEFSSHYITEGLTESKGSFRMQFKPATRGWVVVYAQDNQTKEYKFLGEVKVKASK